VHAEQPLKERESEFRGEKKKKDEPEMKSPVVGTEAKGVARMAAKEETVRGRRDIGNEGIL